MIEVNSVVKAFGDTLVLRGIDLKVGSGEFFCLLGPSGCGKTTLLRMVAGLEKPDAGAIFLSGQDVTHLPPHKRGIAMVFQSYALWPHLTVGENIVYGLEVMGKSRGELAKALDDSLRAYQLTGLEKRMPHQLSGGQQQRVALARAMALRPQALLMDEPLSNLDASLRKTLRRDLMEFHRRAGNTILYVTHDQEEALALSDRIALLMEGTVVETGEPRTLYAKPEKLETAMFLGDANLFIGGQPEGSSMRYGDGLIPLFLWENAVNRTLCIRPEHVKVSTADQMATGGRLPDGRLPGALRLAEFGGPHATLIFETGAGSVMARLPAAQASAFRIGQGVGLEFPSEHRLWYR